MDEIPRSRSEVSGRRATTPHSATSSLLSEERSERSHRNSLPKLRSQMSAPLEMTDDGKLFERFERCHVPPDALAQLHRLHEEFKGQQCQHDASGGCKSDIHIPARQEDLDDSWAESASSWHIFSDLPTKSEASFNTRPWAVRPRTGVEGGALLKKSGIAAVNTKGRKGWSDASIGQDACSISRLSSGWEVLCLFDGHGTEGHWPAMRAARTMPYYLQSSSACTTMLKQDKAAAALHHVFEKVEEDLVRQSVADDIHLLISGCTAVCVLQHARQDKIWVATAGDSKAIMFATGFGLLNATKDHTPDDPIELARVEEMGMEVDRCEHEDGFVEQRLMIRDEEYPGLCMTRSLGDLCVKEHGVTAEPEVVAWDISTQKGEIYMLAASDGVWDWMTPEEVSEVVLSAIARGETLEQACKGVLTKAKLGWEAFDEHYCDDITLMLFPVRHPGRDEAWKDVQAETSCCAAGLGRAGLHRKSCCVM
eukprot:TRINITY_DN76981_c0_g1_i1.p1 TRINITY_DN76981_c0_g1~~TRINITY_DN76981_c0_g1_i1.p1  ORF type:complete len:491 (+),score=113.17 TRINITY_DN76981_c0_g1_i1:35-1474(+)